MLFQPFETKSMPKMTTMIYPLERSLTNLRNWKRKEVYEKASLEHEQSKDKQDIFIDNNPKDVDEIIKAMTPETLTQEQMTLL